MPISLRFSRPRCALLAAVACCTVLFWPKPAHAQDTIFVDDSVSDGLVAHWKFDEPGLTTARAYVGPVSGTLENGAVMGFGPIPPVLTFIDTGVLQLDGVVSATPQRVSIADNAALNLVTNFTVAAWVKRDATDVGTSSTLFDAGDNAGTWFVGFLANNSLTFTTDGVSDFASNLSITDSNYHHVAFSKNGATLVVYLDGVASTAIALPTNIPAPSGAKLVGGKTSNSNAPFGGLIDDLRLYDRALSPVEVQRLAAGKGCSTDGAAWATAIRDLHCALAAATAGDEIWIGAGTYKPGTNPFVAYQLANGVDLFGGFTGVAGAQESQLSERPAFNPSAPLTILSGDLLGNDPATPFGDASFYTDNTNTILLASSGVSATIEGLRVQGGNARTGTGDGRRGGALRASAGANVTLRNVSLMANRSAVEGGAIFSRAPLQLVGATFVQNRALTGPGGALAVTTTVTISASQFLSNTASSSGALSMSGPATIRMSDFQGNRAVTFDGGAIQAFAALTVTDSSFSGNRAGFSGGAISSSQHALVERSLFSADRVDTFDGGAIHASGPLIVRASEFVGNKSMFGGGAIRTSSSTAQIEGSTFTANVALGQNCSPLCSNGEGGAISSSSALTITTSTFLTNSARLEGGAIESLGPLVIASSTLRGNSAAQPANAGNAGAGQGGAIFSSNTLQMTGVTIAANVANVGGGLFATGPAVPTVGNIITITGGLFEANQALLDSGGGAQTEQTAIITNATFRANSAATNGGGLAALAALTVTTSVFEENSTATQGGGLHHFGASPLLVSNSLFVRNSSLSNASRGGAMALFSTGQSTVLHTTIIGPPSSGANAAIAIGNGRFTLMNSIITTHAFAVSPSPNLGAAEDFNLYHNVTKRGLTTGVHSLTGDPIFINPGLGDYHIGRLSPARDSGTDAGVGVDFDGQARPLGSGFDMGFDETTAVAPTAAAGGPYAGLEGSPVALNGGASTDDGTLTSFAWDCTNDGSFEATLPAPAGATCLYPDNGAFTLRLRVTDADGESNDATAAVIVDNVKPVVTAAPAQDAQAGAATTFALGSFTDPGPDAPWQVTVDWGDGSANATLTSNANGAIPSQSHVYALAAVRTVAIRVQDKDGGVGTAAFAITVQDATTPPVGSGGQFLYLPIVED